MAISRYRSRPEGWTYTWTPGQNLVNLYNLYDYHPLSDSNGDLTVANATAIPTTLDGPIHVARFRNLVVNAALTASQRCRGLLLLSDARSTGAAGTVSMTGKGAKGHHGWAVGKDIFIPTSITITGRDTSLTRFFRWIKETGYCIWDPSLWACPPSGLGDVQSDWGAWTPFGSVLISAAGCGIGALGKQVTTPTAGYTGTAGSNAPGSGGSGGANNGSGSAVSGWGGDAYPWGGGPGGGAGYGNFVSFRDKMGGGNYCGKGGKEDEGTGMGAGAGNPAGDNTESGVGGELFDFCRGAVTLASGATLQADGKDGVAGTLAGGGGSGCGAVCEAHAGTIANAGTIRANGGLGGAGASGATGGPGGAGKAASKSFSDMGWA